MSDTAAVTLYGATYSVYVRIARLVLAEVGVPYELVEVDIFAKDDLPAGYADKHPFSKIPAFEHDGFRLFETDAIAHYVIAKFGDGRLMPDPPEERARVIQIMRIMDNYAYPWLVWGVYVKQSESAEPLAAEDVARARKVLRVLDDLAGEPFLVAGRLSLADLWAAPMLACLQRAPTGQTLMNEVPKLATWSAMMAERPSVAATRPPAESDE